MDDAEKRCFEQQDKLQAPSAQPYKAAEYGSEISRNCGRLSFWEALPPGHLDLCRTSPKLGARVLRFLKAAWLRAEPPRPARLDACACGPVIAVAPPGLNPLCGGEKS